MNRTALDTSRTGTLRGGRSPAVLLALFLGVLPACAPGPDDQSDGGTDNPDGSTLPTPHLPPAANLSAEVELGEITLAWEPPPLSDTGHELTGYSVRRSTTEGGPHETVANTVGIGWVDRSAAAGSTYWYVVRALYGELQSAPTDEVFATTAPPQPSGLAVAPDDGVIAVTWNAARGATSYEVRRAEVNAAAIPQTEPQLVAEVEETEFRDADLQPGLRYGYSVRALNDSGASEWTAFRGTTTPPPAPTGLVAQGGVGRVVLNWSEVPGAATYVVSRSEDGGESWTEVGTTAQTTWADENREGGLSLTYVVRARNATGTSGPSQPASALTAPPRPDGLVAAGGVAEIALEWEQTRGATEYRVFRSLTAAGTFDLVAEVELTTWVDTGLEDGLTWHYRVSAVNASGESAQSIARSAITAPPPPATLVATGGTQRVTLTWSSARGATGYRVTRATAPGGPFQDLGPAGNVTGLSFTDTALSEGTTYWHAVHSRNDSGVSAPAITGGATTIPGAPGNLQAQVEGLVVTLSWETVAGAEAYVVLRSTSPTSGFIAVGEPVTGAGFVDGPLEPGRTYYFQVRAANPGGTGPASATTSARTSPGIPSNLVAAGGNGQVTLTWNTTTAATGYDVERATGDGEFAPLQSVTTATLTDTGLDAGSTYRYRVRATNEAGPGAFSLPASVITRPPAPGGVTATGGDASITLDWEPAQGATQYRVYRSATVDGSYAAIGPQLTATGFVDSSVTPGQTWSYVVEAGNASGVGPRSAPVTATSLPARVATLQAAGGAARITLTWQGTQGASSYAIHRAESPTGEFTEIATATASPFIDQPLAAGIARSYRVVARNAAGDAQPSPTASAWTAPATPTGLQVVAASTSQIELSWDASPTAGSVTYEVQRANAEAGPYTNVGAGRTETSFTDSSGSPGRTYWYRVRALNSAGPSDWSTSVPALTLPDRTTGLIAVGKLGQVDLTWTAVNGAVEYEVFQFDADAGDFVSLGLGSGTSRTVGSLAPGTTYRFTVRAHNASGPGALSDERSATTHALAPTNLVAQSGHDSVSLSWTASSGATAYRIKRASSAGGSYETLTPDVTATSFVDGARGHGITWYYQVYALNSDSVESLPSNVASATTVPAAPSTLTAVLSGNDVQLTWSAASGASGYKVFVSQTSGSGFTQADDVTGTTWTHVGPDAGSTYFYVVRAYNPGGESADSPEASITTPPPAPANLQATVTGTSIELTWDVAGGATAYNVERANAPGGNWTTRASNLVATTFNDSGDRGQTYLYRVYATNVGGTGPRSGSVQVTVAPAAPQNVAAVATGTTVRVSWTAPSGATSFRVWRGTTSGGPYDTLAGEPAASPFDDPDLSSSATYFYVVEAVNDGGAGPRSSEASATTSPGGPENLVAVGGDERITLSWSAVTGATEYRVYRSPESPETFTLATTQTGTGWVDENRPAGTTWRYKVAAANAAGEGPQSDPASAITLSPPPANVSAVAGERSIQISWDGSLGATGYILLRAIDDGEFDIRADGLETPGYLDDGLTEGTTYRYRVVAVNASGDGRESAEVSAIPYGDPVDLVATGGNRIVTLSWNHSGGALEYRISRGESPGGPYSPAGSVGVVDGLPPSFTDDNLTPGVRYYYRVQVYNTDGATVGSNEANAITIPAPPATVNALGELEQVSVSWTPSLGTDDYLVFRGNAELGPFTTEVTTTASTLASDGARASGTTYWYVVRARNESGTSGQSFPVSALTLPAKITDVTLTRVGTENISVSWSAVQSATRYTVLRSESASGPFVEIGQPVGTTLTDPGLVGGRTWFYVVRAHNPTGAGPDSEPVGHYLDLPAPTNLSANASNLDVHLSWSPVRGVNQYRVMRATTPGGPYTAVATATGIGHADNDLDPGTRYYYVVVALLGEAESASSNEASALTRPPVPGGISVTGGLTSITVSWTTEATATSYVVERSLGDSLFQALSPSPTTPPFVDTTVDPGVEYTYRVRAVNAAGMSPGSDTDTARTAPPAPTGPSALGGPAAVRVTWQNTTGATGYRVYVSETPGGTQTLAGTTSALTFMVDGLESGTTYYFRVRAVNESGEGPASAQVNATTLSGRLFCVTDYSRSTISAFPWDLDGDFPPVRRFGRTAGHVQGSDLALDADANRLWVVDSGKLISYAADANGAPEPLSTLEGPGLAVPLAVDVDAVNDELVVTNATGSLVAVFDRTATDATTPLRTITGQDTGIAGARAVKSLPAFNEIVVGHLGGVAVFDRLATGNAVPKRVHTTDLTSVSGIDYAALGDHLVVSTTDAVHFVTRTDTTNAGPVRTVSGDSTGLENVVDVAVSEAANEFAVIDFGYIPYLPSEGEDPDPRPSIPQTLRVFALNADGDVAPKRVVTLDRTDYPGSSGLIHVDGTWVAVGTDWVATFTVGAENAANPLRLLTAATSGVSQPWGLASDIVGGELVVANQLDASLSIFDIESDGPDTTPLRRIVGPTTLLSQPTGVALRTATQEVYVADATGAVYAFDVTQTGDVAPTRVIAGEDTLLENPVAVVYDAVANEVFVADTMGDQVLVFDGDADGDVAPKRIISGATSQVSAPSALYLDRQNNHLFVATPTSVVVHSRTANGNPTPVRRLSGMSTQINSPMGLLVNNGTNELLVTTASGEILAFPRTWSGTDVAPVRRMGGQETQLWQPWGLSFCE